MIAGSSPPASASLGGAAGGCSAGGVAACCGGCACPGAFFAGGVPRACLGAGGLGGLRPVTDRCAIGEPGHHDDVVRLLAGEDFANGGNSIIALTTLGLDQA